MTLYGEARGGQLVDARSASLHLEHLLARLAEEVVVMVRVLALVMRRGSRDFHDLHGAHIDEDTEGAVNSGDTQPWRQGAGHIPYVGRRHGTTGIFERLLDG